jgi:hypothetical protein
MNLPDTKILVWSDLDADYAELLARPVDAGTLYTFLVDWSDLSKSIEETATFLQLAADLNTADVSAQERLSHFHRVTQPAVKIAAAVLRRKVLAVQKPAIPAEAFLVLRRMQTDELIYREENVQIPDRDRAEGRRAKNLHRA